MQPSRSLAAREEPDALAWARSGAMTLTGWPDADPMLCPAPLASAADGALAVVAGLAPDPLPASIDGAQLLGERAALAGLTRAGDTACGGACRLLPTAEGSLALNLARPDDWELLPAWLETERPADWHTLRAAVAARTAQDLVVRGRELGLAVAAVDSRHEQPARWFRLLAEHAPGARRRRDRPRVVDLTSLWAGPLCTHLLQLGGAEVLKVESLARPDGARLGPRAFFDLLNAGKRCIALDFAQAAGRAQLLALLRDADLVIEASRPRALRQLGIDAQRLVAEVPGLTWISLTGHGRGEPQENWIAYGDDAGVEAGLSGVMRDATGRAMFVGDAIGDPLAGLHAAALAWWSWRQGGSRLVSVALGEVVRSIVERVPVRGPQEWRERYEQGQATLRQHGAGARAPRARAPTGIAHALGADTAAVMSALVDAC